MNPAYSVSQVNSYIKRIFEEDSVLHDICVKGEVSDCKYHSSGHIYFSIKDESGQLSCVMFAGKRNGLSFTLEKGMSVLVNGSIAVYERDGKYQLYAVHIEKEGQGALFERFELLKRKLEKEGLFDPLHKKNIPPYCSTIGIVTASTGAAIHDIITVATRRNPYVKLILYPARVQGEGAAKTIISGIKTLEKIKPDCIIIGRGGGSIEDLFEFNDEELARTIYDCPIPIISGVGHEIDYTIADFAADLRAATPSAAAELATYDYMQLNSRLVDYHSELLSAMTSKIDYLRNLTEKKALKLSLFSPNKRISNLRLKSDGYDEKLSNLINSKLTHTKSKFDLLCEKLEGLSPVRKLKLGYSYVSDSSGKNVRSIKSVNIADEITVAVTDGIIKAQVTDTVQYNLKSERTW